MLILPQEIREQYQDKRITKEARGNLIEHFCTFFERSDEAFRLIITGDPNHLPTFLQYQFFVDYVPLYYEYYVNRRFINIFDTPEPIYPDPPTILNPYDRYRGHKKPGKAAKNSKTRRDKSNED